jgi:hypothetical protein
MGEGVRRKGAGSWEGRSWEPGGKELEVRRQVGEREGGKLH